MTTDLVMTPPPANSLPVLIDWLKQACKRRANSAQDPGRPMRTILAQLLAPTEDEGPVAVKAREKVLMDLVTGAYGHGLMLDSIIELDSDCARTLDDQPLADRAREAGHSAISNSGLYLWDSACTDDLDYRVLLCKLIWIRENWAAATVVDMFAGGYGQSVRQLAAAAATAGLGLGTAITSFAETCIQTNQLDILSSVAGLGRESEIPASAVKVSRRGATTAGRWLDALVVAGNPAKGSMLFSGSYTQYMQTKLDSPVGPVLADILVRHDPEHRGIRDLVGSPTHAQILAALMNLRLEGLVEPASAVEPKRTHLPLHRNRAL